MSKRDEMLRNLNARGFVALQGKVLVDIIGCTKGSEDVRLVFADRTTLTLRHSPSCCESVFLEDVAGDPNDLLGHRIELAEVVTSGSEAPNPSHPEPAEFAGELWQWTFYKLRSHGGDLTLRWFGASNGYYSVEVDERWEETTDMSEAALVRRDAALERDEVYDEQA